MQHMTGEDPLKDQFIQGIGQPPYLAHLFCNDTASGKVEMVFDLPRLGCMACDPWFVFQNEPEHSWRLMGEADNIWCILPGARGRIVVVRATNSRTDLGEPSGIIQQEMYWDGKLFRSANSRYLTRHTFAAGALNLCRDQLPAGIPPQ